jgi:hypothetical protein
MGKTLKKPPEDVVLACFPAWDIPETPLRDLGLTNVTHAETLDSLRLPRPGQYEATLVAVRKYYDGTGTGGGAPGHYLALWHELRHLGQRWKTPTLKVRAEEAERVARAMLARKASNPGKGEVPRTSGRAGDNDQSKLLGVPVGKDGYLLFVRSTRDEGETFFRSRGVEVRGNEAVIVASMLRQLEVKS